MTTPAASGQMENAQVTFTPRERMLRALRCEPADRVPAWLMRQAGRYLPQYHDVRRNYDFLELCKTPEAAAEVSIQPLEGVGSEAVIIFNDIMLPLEHAGAKVVFDEKGPLVENPVRTREELAALKLGEVRHGEPIARTIQITRERVGNEIPILGFVGAPWTLACYWVEGRIDRHFSRIGTLRFTDPELLDQLLERITGVVIDYLKIQIHAGADAVQIFDTWGPVLSQSEWGRFSGPHIKRIVEAVKSLGAPVIVYMNGCAPYLDQMIELGADCLSIDWRVDLARAREIVPANIALQGNLDPLALLAGEEATVRAVNELFERFAARPGHIFNLGHGVLPGTPVAAVQALLREVKRLGRYA